MDVLTGESLSRMLSMCDSQQGMVFGIAFHTRRELHEFLNELKLQINMNALNHRFKSVTDKYIIFESGSSIFLHTDIKAIAHTAYLYDDVLYSGTVEKREIDGLHAYVRAMQTLNHKIQYESMPDIDSFNDYMSAFKINT